MSGKASSGRYEVLVTSLLSRDDDGNVRTYRQGSVIQLTTEQAEKLLSRDSVKPVETRGRPRKAETESTEETE